MISQDLKRLDEAFQYLQETTKDTAKITRLKLWVYKDPTWLPVSISQAISIDKNYSWRIRVKDRPKLRQLVHACLLTKVAAEDPPNLSMAEQWKRNYYIMPDAWIEKRLSFRIKQYLDKYVARLKEIPPLLKQFEKARTLFYKDKRLVVNGKLSQEFIGELKKWAESIKLDHLKGHIEEKLRFTPVYGLRGSGVSKSKRYLFQTIPKVKSGPSESLEELHKLEWSQLKKKGQQVVSIQGYLPEKPKDPVPFVPTTVQEKILFFEKLAPRPNIVLAGHGVWAYDHEKDEWPVTKLNGNQTISFYIYRGMTLHDWLGQLVESRQPVVPTEEFSGPKVIWDYTLLPPKGWGTELTFRNIKGDNEFKTVKEPKRLSQFLKEYPTANFHWAACREYYLGDVKKGPSGKSDDVKKKIKRQESLFTYGRVRWNTELNYWEIWVNIDGYADTGAWVTGWLEIPDTEWIKTLEKSKGLHGIGAGPDYLPVKK